MPKQTLSEIVMVEAAKRYAAADNSDPFAMARALCHIQSGVASSYNSEGQGAFYGATPYQETRVTPDGEEYHVTVYRNRHRP